MKGGAILRRVHLAAAVYIGGFLPLWLLAFTEAATVFALRVIFAGYAIAGAALVLWVYVRLSRCAACHRFVPLPHARQFSASYCSHCGNKLHA